MDLSSGSSCVGFPPEGWGDRCGCVSQSLICKLGKGAAPFVTAIPGASGFLWASYRKDQARPSDEPSHQALTELNFLSGALQGLQRRNCWFRDPPRPPQLGLFFHCHKPFRPSPTTPTTPTSSQGPARKSHFLSALSPAWAQKSRVASS